MSGIAETLISGLDADPGLAFIELAERVENYMASNTVDASDAYVIRAVINRFCQINREKKGFDVKLPNFEKSQSLDLISYFIRSTKEFKVEKSAEIAAKRVDTLLSIENQIRENATFGIAQLSEDEKKQARRHIISAREIISNCDLAERKKKAILDRLMDAERELDTIGTRTDRFFALMGDAAFVLGDMAEKAQPFTSEVKEILKIVFRGRENTEGVRLQKADEPLLLPPSEG